MNIFLSLYVTLSISTMVWLWLSIIYIGVFTLKNDKAFGDAVRKMFQETFLFQTCVFFSSCLIDVYSMLGSFVFLIIFFAGAIHFTYEYNETYAPCYLPSEVLNDKEETMIK